MNDDLTTERWHALKAAFAAVHDLEPAAREAALITTCFNDAALREEVRALLQAHDTRGPLDDLMADLVAPMLDDLDASPPAPRHVGPYEVLHELGRGGMGHVYKAHDPRLDRFVALKFLPPHLSANASAKARFMQEAKAISVLDHPNLCTIYDIGETDDGQLYIAMPCYEGQTLAKALAHGPLSVSTSLDIGRQMARGLASAHAAGVIHRDIKPSNVIITDAGIVKILDFGIAKLDNQPSLTQTGTQLGTVAYMAPEQTRSAAIDPRADVWAWGVVLYEMLAGRRPFRGTSLDAIVYAIRHDAPEPVSTHRPTVPPSIDRVVARALAKDPADRYPDMAALLHALPASNRTAAPFWTWPLPLIPRLHQWGVYVAGVAVLLAVLLVAPHLAVFPNSPTIRSLAVLPLMNYSEDPNQDYLANGVTETLIADLGQIEALRVISRTSAMQYKETEKSLPEIARELQVDAIVEGSVRTAGDRVGITVQLIDGATDQILWTRSYERPLGNVITLQREVALAIAREIEATLTPREEALLTTTSTVHPAAYKHYLWGLHFRNLETPESWQQAITHFERSIALDATFAPAYAQLARVYIQVADASQAATAKRAAQRALVLDPALSDAYVSMGLLSEMIDWDWGGAERAFRQALRHNPGDGEAHHELGLLLMRQGRFAEALVETQRALDVDPLSARFLNGVAAVHLFSRRYEVAIERLQQSLALRPNNSMTYWRLGQAYLAQGRHDEAIAAFEQMVALGGVQAQGHLGHAYAIAGRRAKAQRMLDALTAQGRPDSTYNASWLPWNVALIHTGLGNDEQALDALEQAYAVRSNLLMYLNVLPAFDPLRLHPRFQTLLEQTGLG